MQTYKVHKYFQWGSLHLEPNQSLIVNDSTVADSYELSINGKEGSMKVGKKAFEQQVKIGSISAE